LAIKTVLIADDDPNMVQILSHILSAEGFEVVTENNGKSALENALRIKPDLLVLDFIMPLWMGLPS
jgi:two-component system response regulator MtrA